MSINCQSDGTCARIMTILRAPVDLVTFHKSYLHAKNTHLVFAIAITIAYCYM